ncbi:hypothetical protein CRE_02345 [Caenorhabditis remanei]|uniref:Uncharacterized protein n=1 Tax=Caenorhabditis remanei TaxID=31234 RepID=E3MIL5_CAERE|nr:hypothetical protein CRE_02345 [Caenorhabditis remanei]
MRLLAVLVAVGFFVTRCSTAGTFVKFSIAIHCPSGELGVWSATLSIEEQTTFEDLAIVGGTTSDKFQFIEIKGFSFNFKAPANMSLSAISASCKPKSFGGVLPGKDYEIPIPRGGGFHYGFRVYNMEDDKDKTNSETYEYLFMKYLEKDCAMNECKESSREYVAKGCDFFKNEASQCMKGYDDTLPKYCQKDGSSVHSLCSEYISTTSSTKMIIIICGAVGAIVVLVLAIGVFFYCRKKKKSKQNMTGTMSGSGTISGTTQQSTATTGTPTRATTTTGAATTTGAQRY